MERRFRVSAIGRIRPGITHEAIKAIVVAQMAAKGLKTGDLRWRTIPAPGGAQLFGQFATVVPAAELDDAWNISASRAFSDAGFGDLIWKITPVGPDDADGEKTNGSIPRVLMRQELDADEPTAVARSPLPPEPFGSDRFWEWFEAGED